MSTPPFNISDEMIEVFDAGYESCACPAPRTRHCCLRAGLGAVAPLIAVQVLRPVEQAAECGCPITVERCRITRHTKECSTRQSAERMAQGIASEFDDEPEEGDPS